MRVFIQLFNLLHDLRSPSMDFMTLGEMSNRISGRDNQLTD